MNVQTRFCNHWPEKGNQFTDKQEDSSDPNNVTQEVDQLMS